MSGTPVNKRHWLEYTATAALLVISVLSLWVAIGTEDANRQMVAASSWPFLQINSSNGDGKGHSVLLFEISNSGVGPAKVKSFEMFWKGRPYATSTALAAACCGFRLAHTDLAATGGDVPDGILSTARVTRTVIRAGDSATFITFPLTEQNATVWRKFDHERETNIRFRVCYCSVFDECWIDSFTYAGDTGPNRVGTCPVPKVPYDQ